MAEILHDIKVLEDLSADIIKANSPRARQLAQDAFEVQVEVIFQSYEEYLYGF